MGWYALTIFLSAFLLFEVQPLMGKYILPWFGGGAGIWTACMLFFQCSLLVGYSYAHLISNRLRPSRQMLLHIGALALSLLLLPITPESSWKPLVAEHPTRQILLLLVVNIGVPFALLSSTGPLLSHWFSRSFAGRSPYRLYALSNAGSLLALLSYPFVVEPFLALHTQAWAWSSGYGAFVLLCAWCAWQFSRSSEQVHPEKMIPGTGSGAPGAHLASKAEPHTAPSSTDMVMWLVLAANASVMLLATTQQVSQDLAVIPLLWVLPLALYLLSFILCFDHDWWYKRWLFGPLLAVGALAVVYMMTKDLVLSVWIQIGIYSITLFACCMVCHGELAQIRPSANYLTRFYLIIATGGALGGVMVAVIAPYVFNDFWEYHLGLISTCVLAMICVHRHRIRNQRTDMEKTRDPDTKKDRKQGKRKKRGRNRRPAHNRDSARVLPQIALMWGGALLVFLAIIVGLARDVSHARERTIVSSRSFFGVTQIQQQGDNVRLMEHGRTIHGIQVLSRNMRREPTTYYGRDSGIGIALREYRRLQTKNNDAELIQSGGSVLRSNGNTLRIGAIGLGAGTMAALTEPGDYLRYYEIDPDVERLARRYFTYLDDAAAVVDVILGDARIMLEHEAQSGLYQKFDVLAVDAFNSDAVPLHLLTREALDLYLAHLKPLGLLAFHVTNRYANLSAVVRGLAENTDREVVRIYSTGSAKFTLPAEWVIMTNNRAFLAAEGVQVAAAEWSDDESLPILWTDEYASLWRAVAAKTGGSGGVWDSAPNKGQFVLDYASLISATDISQIRKVCRRLFQDTDGKRAIMIVTRREMPSKGERTISPTAYLEMLYRNYRLFENSGMMILISVGNDLAFVKVPKDWPPQLRHEVTRAVSTMMVDGTAAKDFSARLVSAIEAIDVLMRSPL